MKKMNDEINEIPKPKEVYIHGKRYVKPYISYAKLAEMRIEEMEHTEGVTETYDLPRDAKPTEAQRQMIAAAATHPIVYDEDCPKSSPERLERFRRYGQERNRLRAGQL